MKTAIIAMMVILTTIEINAEIFSSMDQLLSLPNSLISVINYFEELVKFQENRNHLIEKVIDKFKTMADQANKDPKKFIANPVNSFIIIKIFSTDLATIFDHFKSDQVLQTVQIEIRKKIKLPDENDYLGSIRALLRLQETFDLNSSQIIEGTFGDSVSIRPLNAFECFEIGRIAQMSDDHHVAVDWFNQSNHLMGVEGDASTVNRIGLLNYMTHSYYQLGDIYKAVEISKQLIDLDPKEERFLINLEFFQTLLADKLIEKYNQTDEFASTDMSDIFEHKSVQYREPKGFDQDAYERLCRATNPDMSKNANLKCRYARYHPLLVIAPVKEEQVHDDPPIWVYYEVISKRLAQEMIKMARPILNRALVVSDKPDLSKVSDVRVSQNGWLWEEQADFLPKLSKLLSALTNLSMETAEPWQMNNYGLGGVYEPHHDFTRAGQENTFDRKYGLRIATWMFYLEAPEQGGATVFPNVGARVSPVERSAAFWFNLLPNGERDYRTLHSGCPVLVGSKWVSNRWIRSFGQEFRRPCV